MSSGTARATFTRMRDGTAEPDPGYAVSRLAHSLRSATRAERDSRPADYIVAALIHDLGDGVAPYSHGSYAAAVQRPFVSEELCWIVSHHPLRPAGAVSDSHEGGR